MGSVQDSSLSTTMMFPERDDEHINDIWTNLLSEILDIEMNKDDTADASVNLNDQVNELYKGNLDQYYSDLDTLLVNLNQEDQATIEPITSSARESCMQKEIHVCDEIDIQSANLDQATKSISICLCWDALQYGQERLEAEKVLLLADLKRNILLEKNLKTGCDAILNGATIKTVSVTISDMELPFLVQQSNPSTSWYAIMCSCDAAVVASSLLQFPSGSKSLVFPETFILNNVTYGSTIRLQLFELQMEDLHRESESVYRLLCFNKKPSAVPREERIIEYKDSSGLAVRSTVLSTIFQLRSSLAITVQPNGIPVVVSECCDLSLQASVSVQAGETDELFAFVAAGKEFPSYMLQGNYWCPFNENVLQIWHNSHELVICVDLDCTFQKHAQHVDKFIVGLPRMVLVDVNFGTVTKRYYMATDTERHLELWADNLNALRMSLNSRKFKGNNVA